MFRCDTTLFVSKKLPVHLIAECDNDLSISYLNNMKCQDVSSVMDYFDCQVCFFIVIIFYGSLEEVGLGIFSLGNSCIAYLFLGFFLMWRQCMHELQRSVVCYFLCNLYTRILMQ